MKSLLFLVLMLSTLTSVWAQDLGVGAMVGRPTGVTAKKWLDSDKAIDAGAGWSFGSGTNFQLHGDYLWNKTDALYFEDTKPLDLYFGLGGVIEFDDEIEIGARIPVGLAFFFSERQAELFSEVAPIVRLLPDTGVDLQFLIGFRIYL